MNSESGRRVQDTGGHLLALESESLDARERLTFLEDLMDRDPLVSRYAEMHPWDYSELDSLCVKCVGTLGDLLNPPCIDLRLGLRGNAAYPQRRLALAFFGVSRFRFVPGPFVPVRVLLEIVCIRDRQWEGVAYQVFNVEQDVELSFYCRAFDVEFMG